MSNSLLDFVMAVVRDPDVAASYAADPTQAIADAGLTDVTIADVNQLIPVVSETVAPAADANVWATGAATAAFDAFGIDDAVPTTVDDLHYLDIPSVVDTAPEIHDVGATLDDVFTSQDLPVSPVIVDEPVADPVFEPAVADWSVPEQPADPEHHDFHTFD